MLDFRHETFKVLCHYKNYAKAAELLHITQPAVSQHIKYLENLYQTVLIAEKGKRFSLSKAGTELLLFIQACDNGIEELKKRMMEADEQPRKIVIGATRSVGEGIMPNLMAALLAQREDIALCLIVDNTNILLEKIQNGEIHFALIEGYFDTSFYKSIPFSNEEFIAVCSSDSVLAQKEIPFSAVLGERNIVREPGSGSREICEEILHENHLNLQQFRQLIEVNNLAAIKKMVAKQAGISFLYKFSAKDELRSGELAQIRFEDFSAFRKLHFIYPKDSLTGIDYMYWFDEFYDIYTNRKEING